MVLIRFVNSYCSLLTADLSAENRLADRVQGWATHTSGNRIILSRSG